MVSWVVVALVVVQPAGGPEGPPEPVPQKPSACVMVELATEAPPCTPSCNQPTGMTTRTPKLPMLKPAVVWMKVEGGGPPPRVLMMELSTHWKPAVGPTSTRLPSGNSTAPSNPDVDGVFPFMMVAPPNPRSWNWMPAPVVLMLVCVFGSGGLGATGGGPVWVAARCGHGKRTKGSESGHVANHPSRRRLTALPPIR